MSVGSLLFADYARYATGRPSWGAVVRLAFAKPGFRAVLLHRVSHALWRGGHGGLAGLTQRVMHHACHCYISAAARIGPGFLIAHVGGIVIGGKTVIGAGCDIRQNVTMGGNFNRRDADGRTQPVLADGVSVGAGACILGPVRVGEGAIVGANSVVTRDVEPGWIVSGVPARPVKPRWDEQSGRKL